MGTVTSVFAQALARAAGLEFTEDGRVMRGVEVLRRFTPSGDQLGVDDYFTMVEWVRREHPDRGGLPIAYAEAVDIDNLGALGLAIKTAPTLKDSLLRAERYFRLLTDTVAYRLDEESDPAEFILLQQTAPHPALALRNECALCGFGRIFKELTGEGLAYAFISFAHEAEAETGRYESYFGCPVRFNTPRNAIGLAPSMLNLPMRLGDPAVSRFLTAHLDTEMEELAPAAAFERSLAAHISEGLSNGIPKAASVAQAIGVSERTLFRRLAESGLTYQDVLENTQKSLAEELLKKSEFSIAEVAFLTGFSEQSTFSRAFKRWMGQTPGAFRKGPQPA